MTALKTRVNPIVLEIVEGTVDAAEGEIESAVERTARSPFIRDQHDYRPGIFDRRGRKLSGRSYSALVEPILRDFPIETMREGDVFLHNDVYLSEGSIGHLPDLCTTVPVFHGGRIIAFIQVFGHHDDVGGMVPGSLPTRATSIYQEGLQVPPIKLFDAGRLNVDAYKIVARNSRLPDHLIGDLDAERGACALGVRRLQELCDTYGADVVEACFDAMIEKCARTMREEIFPRIKDGTYTWEDYIEHDGVTPPRLHTLKLTITKTPEKIVLDFNGTDPQAVGPINWAPDYGDGRYLKKWVGPILRNLAETPERAAALPINEGICDVLEVIFPPKGTLITPRYPAPTGMRFVTFLRVLGIFAGTLALATNGKMPADQETIRIWGIHGTDDEGRFYLFREVLGGGSGGRHYADGSDVIHIVPHSRNLPAEFSETVFPVRIERLSLCPDSGGPGKRRGGLGYWKDVRILRDCTMLSNADRSLLSCYGANGGRAGGPYRAIVNPGTPEERILQGFSDDVKLKAGDLVRIITTGGGGWGDPLERDPEEVRLDVIQGKVTPESAERDYGVLLIPAQRFAVDAEATARTREGLRARCGAPPFFDRGKNYQVLLRGDIPKLESPILPASPPF